jgi:hypothetical protein
MRAKALLICLALLAGLCVSAGSAAEEEVIDERDFHTDVDEAVVGIIKSLPEIRKARKQAEKLAAELPDYSGDVEVPSSELIYSWMEDFCSTPHRRPGTLEGARAEEWVAEKFAEFGYNNVQMDPVPITVWEADKWSLEVEGNEVPSFFVLNTGFTGEDGVTAPLVYVGEGREKDFAKTNVEGKIVVAEVPFPFIPTGLLLRILGGAYYVSNPDNSLKLTTAQYLNFVRLNFKGQADEKHAPPDDVYWNAYKNGAAAVCLILCDQPSALNTHYGPYDGIMKPLPALWIGKYDGERLRKAAKKGAQARFVQTGSKTPGQMRNVWVTLPGMTDDVILVTSHHDSPFQGAIEDGSGTTQVLAQAWAWSKVPIEQRPKTLVFVVDGGHFYGSKGAFAFAKQHPDIMRRADILLTLEHLAAKEVEEKDGEYAPTGDLALTVVFTSNETETIAGLIKALENKPSKRTASIPSTFFGEAPTSDAAGYVLESGVPVISWIGCPYYLLDSGDTLDKIEVSELQPVAETASEIVKTFMVME